MDTPIRLTIADDHALFREGLRSLLALRPEVKVVAEVDKVEAIAATLQSIPCDILLLDLQMNRNALPELAALAARVTVIVVTASEEPGPAIAAVRAGARAVVFKRFAVETLVSAIMTVAGGQVWLPPELQGEVVKILQEPTHLTLTAREREVVQLVGLGLRNAEVAMKLHISEETVKTHLNNVFRKLDVRDRVELVRYAARFGLVGLRE